MSGSNEIWLYDPYGNLLQNLRQVQAMAWSRALNDVGGFKIITSPAQFPDNWYALDRRIVIWRKTPEGGKSQVFAGFMRMPEKKFRADGKAILEITGYDNNHLLTRRIINAAAGSAGSSKSGPADDVMKEYVDEWLGASASAEDSLTGLGFSVETPSSLGPNIAISASRDNLLTTLRAISKATIEAGSPVYFDIVNPTPDTFVFKTYIGTRGIDRTTGATRKVFAPEFNNLVDPEFRVDHRNEINVAVVGGPGEGLNRAVVTVTDADRAAASPFNRIVAFVDARNEPISDLQSVGETLLREHQPEVRFSAKIIDTPSNRYGPNWGLGDKVIAAWGGKAYEVEIWGVGAVLNDQGRESLSAQVEEFS